MGWMVFIFIGKVLGKLGSDAVFLLTPEAGAEHAAFEIGKFFHIFYAGLLLIERERAVTENGGVDFQAMPFHVFFDVVCDAIPRQIDGFRQCFLNAVTDAVFLAVEVVRIVHAATGEEALWSA